MNLVSRVLALPINELEHLFIKIILKINNNKENVIAYSHSEPDNEVVNYYMDISK